jgi:hypothetical protein
MTENEPIELENEAKTQETGLYKTASKAVDKWLRLHKGETFDLDVICRQMEIKDSEKRNLITIKLAYEVKQGKLEKSNRIYRYIDNTTKYINWLNNNETETLKITWPYGIEDQTHFGFDGHAVISPGDVIGIAGVTNTGKTTWATNFLWCNMDDYPCTLMGNEYTAGKFKRRIQPMLAWANPLKDDGVPKFELIDRRSNWKDIIRPNGINIVDWIDPRSGGFEFYDINMIIEGMQSKLDRGILMFVLQKDPNKDTGTGGQSSEHLSSLYLTMDFGKMTVRKCKEWNGHDPNREMYGFTIVNQGCQFHGIHRVKTCPKCWGKSALGHYKCPVCFSKGYVDFEDAKSNLPYKEEE